MGEKRSTGSVLIFDPITGERRVLERQLVVGISEMHTSLITRARDRQAFNKNMKCYMLHPDTDTKELSRLMNNYRPVDEQWKHCLGISKEYMVSNYGRVKRIYKTKERILMPYTSSGATNSKYLKLKMKREGENKPRETRIRTLIAQVFLYDNKPIPEGAKFVNGDGNVWNNRAENIQLMTKEYLAKISSMSRGYDYCVAKLDDKGNIVQAYRNYAEAGRDNFVCRESIRLAASGLQKTAAGFRWARITEEEYEEYSV